MLRTGSIAVLIFVLAAVAVSVSVSVSAAATVGYAFTYQGSLKDTGVSASGPYDFRFALFDMAGGGTQVSTTVVVNDLSVTDGIFTADLDFDYGPFQGEERWLQVEVRQGASSGAYTTLPRQRLAPTPFSIGLSLPHFQEVGSADYLLHFTNSGGGGAAIFDAQGTQLNYAVHGRNMSTAFNSAGVLGEATGPSGFTIGVEGRATGSPSGTGVLARGTATGAYISGEGANSTGLYAYGYAKGLHAENLGVGPAAYLLGKGQTRTNATLRVENTEPVHGMSTYMHNSSDFATAHFQNDSSGEVLWVEHHGTGNYIVATSGSDWKFWVDNNGVTHTKVLEILGGADLSEKFDVHDEGRPVEPGTVVSIDKTHEGRLVESREPYDHRVAGIISGAGGVKTGMLMGQEGTIADGSMPVALTGRVYCRASAVNGPIEPGDLLTTSSVPGCAMRVSDPARAQGAILGKAMGSLAKGEGLVLVLVGLQ
jgi:hypothetical protein